jgi:hypothetical protein
VYAVTFYFELAKNGWSEVYYSTLSESAIQGAAAGAWQARGAMLGKNSSATYCRVSDVTIKRDLVLHGNAAFNPIQGKLGTCSLAQQGIDVKMFTEDDKKWSTRIFRGVPDGMFDATKPNGVSMSGAWIGPFTQFAKILAAGFGMKIKGGTFQAYTTAQVIRATTKRVGRPFGLFRGRKRKAK